MIKLVNDTIDKNDIDKLIEWLKTYPKLTKGELTIQFEEKWSRYLNRKYSVFVNSGSSANLAMIYALMQSGYLKNKKVIAPTVSWATTITPLVQLGLDTILCDTDKDILGVDVEHLEKLFIEHNPSVLLIVHVLGFPNKMKEILELCEKYDVILLEDSCESVGTLHNLKMTGQFGLMSTFSTYFGHHFSTIEGGLISTDDFHLYNILKSIRSHGWDRDMDEEYQIKLRDKYSVDEFSALYTFYYPGFNIRSTDLQAFIGLNQLDKLDNMNESRYKNFLQYQSLIKNDYWKVNPSIKDKIINFAYPIIHPNRSKIVDDLNKNKVANRPLICGSIANQPFFKDLYGETNLNFSNIVDKFGLYLPNNPHMSEEEIDFVCKIINRNL